MGAYFRSGRRLVRSSTHNRTYLGPFLHTKVILNGAFTAGKAPTGEQRLRLLAPTKACNTSTSGSLLLIWVMASESWGNQSGTASRCPALNCIKHGTPDVSGQLGTCSGRCRRKGPGLWLPPRVAFYGDLCWTLLCR